MRDLTSVLQRWVLEERDIALARVVSTWGSAPRRPGAAMLIDGDSNVAGSVSGGCIEGEVIRAALDCMRGGQRRLIDFGVDSETAWAAGLSCGGRIEVLVQHFPASAIRRSWLAGLIAGVPVRIETAVDGLGEAVNAQNQITVSSWPDRPSTDSMAQTGIIDAGGRRIFVHQIPRASRLLIVGGADISVQLVALASRLDFEITVLDPRSVFTRQDRFDVRPDHLVTAWPQEFLQDYGPDEETYAVLLTHDPKIDDPALLHLLRSPVQYIGALGGRKTQEKRRQRLLDAGVDAASLRRIHGPVGLPIGAASPGEIAVSILAQVVAARNGL